MELELIRKYLKDDYTIGRLSINDHYQCETLEDRVRDLQDYNHDGDFDDPGEGKIYGKTAIPPGRYRVTVMFSPKRRRKIPLLHDVPGFKNIQIHAGNSAKDTKGCILVGENKKVGRVLNSRYHEAVIVNLIEGAIFNGEQIFITIKQ